MKTLASHLSTFEGDLYDNRTNKVIRHKYEWHFREISNTQQFKATLRAGAYAWPGGYPLFFLLSDGATLSFEALQEKSTLRAVLSSIREKANDGWRVVGCDVNWEDSEMTCAHTGKRIPSAYGE